jgi:hypothetical protein
MRELTLLQTAGQWNYPLEVPWDGILVDDPGREGMLRRPNARQKRSRTNTTCRKTWR